MIKGILLNIRLMFVLAGIFSGLGTSAMGRDSAHWKVGVAKTIITPDQSMWLAGYAARNKPSEGTLHDLWARAIVFEDQHGQKGVLVTMDVLRIHKELSDSIRHELHRLYGLAPSQIILNTSHTHSGPEVDVDRYKFMLDASELNKISSFASQLQAKVVSIVGEALAAMVPAHLFAGNGVARFAVNRRNNSEADASWLNQLNGPMDHAVPVIKAVDETGEVIAIVFGYACHPTVLDTYQWSGDYAGFAQLALEEKYPAAMALFFQGAGGDQNPMPRRSVALAKQYGLTLAASVVRMIEEDMEPLAPQFASAYSEVELGFAKPSPSREELSTIIESHSKYPRWIRHHAEVLLDKLDRGETLMTSYPYPVQLWKMGDQPIVSLGGELVVDYALRLKRIFGNRLFVMGYANDVMAYIPSKRVLTE